MNYYQYELVIVILDPTLGNEIKKTRPCVIISPNELNHNINTVIIAPITSTSKDYPTRVAFQLDGQKNLIVLDQLRTIDKIRIVKQIGNLDESTILKVKAVITEMLVD